MNDRPIHPGRSFPEFRTAEYLARRRQAVREREGEAWKGVDDSGPQCPAGHARGMQISVQLTSDYRRTHQKAAMDIKPQDVIDVLNSAGIKKWVLMGLHGYVGYLSQPRATQYVDVLVSQHDRRRAVKAIRAAWPSLVMEELQPVVRFKDPSDCFSDGQPKPVIDLMLTWSTLNEAIWSSPEFVTIDPDTQHCIPVVEAALAAKYAAMISDFRDQGKKEYDAGDFRGIARANYDRIDRERLRRLGNFVWEGGGAELERFVEIAIRNEPFVIGGTNSADRNSKCDYPTTPTIRTAVGNS